MGAAGGFTSGSSIGTGFPHDFCENNRAARKNKRFKHGNSVL
jgi:hypothetical protein